MTVRFAIYAAPGTGAAVAAAPVPGGPVSVSTVSVGTLLRERAEQWLGRSVTAAPVAPGLPDGWARTEIDAITVDARRYGFHATLKPPFRLADGRTPEELDAALAGFAASHADVTIPRLSLGRLGGFFALVPGAEAADLYALADQVVTELDAFRAPPTEMEIARRRPEKLTSRQRELLTAWGYPYVFDEFRVHLTLTDRLPEARWPALERTLSTWFAEVIGEDVPVDALALFIEPEPGAPFQLHAVYPLQSR